MSLLLNNWVLAIYAIPDQTADMQSVMGMPNSYLCLQAHFLMPQLNLFGLDFIRKVVKSEYKSLIGLSKGNY